MLQKKWGSKVLWLERNSLNILSQLFTQILQIMQPWGFVKGFRELQWKVSPVEVGVSWLQN